MKTNLIGCALTLSLTLATTLTTTAQTPGDAFVTGDLLPNAPDLAPRGTYGVGVRTMKVVHPAQVDVLHLKDGKHPLYDRPLTLEI